MHRGFISLDESFIRCLWIGFGQLPGPPINEDGRARRKSRRFLKLRKFSASLGLFSGSRVYMD
jgi:hypothetical protein